MNIEQVKQLLADTLAEPPADRESFLGNATRGDPQLYQEVIRLLRLLDEAGDFLSEPLWHDSSSLQGQCLQDRYLLGAVLGRGGFSTVYRAQDLRLGNRPVAVKVLEVGLFREELANKEIQALAQIDHPGVVGILDAGELEGGGWFLVRRLVEGLTLRELLQERGRLNESEVRIIAMQLLASLDAAHQAGVLHLDLKPENIVLRAWGGEHPQAVMIDFGSAIGSPVRTRSFGIHRSVYQAPEVEQGQVHRGSDLYSIGVIVREMLPEDPQLQQRWKHLWEVRFDSSPKMAAALPRTRSLVSRGTAGFLAAALMMLLAFFFTRLETRYRIQPFTALSGLEQCPAFSRDGKHIYFVRALETTADIFVKPIGGGSVEQITNDAPKETHLRVSPGGSSLAFLRFIGKGLTELTVLDLHARKQKVIAKGLINSFCWNASGDRMVVSISSGEPERLRLRILNVDSGTWSGPVSMGVESWEELNPSISADGRQLAFVRKAARNASTLMKVNLDESLRANGSAVPLHSNFLADIVAPRWIEGDGALLFVGGDPIRRRLYRLPARGGTPQIQNLAIGPLEWLDTTAQLNRLVVSESHEDGNIWRLDLLPNKHVAGMKPVIQGKGTDEEVVLSPDGRRIAFVSARSGATEVWMALPDGSEEKLLWKNLGSDPQVHWAGNRTLYISESFSHGYELVEIDVEGRLLRKLDVPERMIGISRDRRAIFVAANDNLGVWKVNLETSARSRVWKESARRIVEGPDGALWICTRKNEISRLHQGTLTRIAESVQYRMYDVGRQGLYYVPQNRPFRIMLDQLEGSAPIVLANLVKRPTFGFALDAREESIYFSQFDQDGEDLALIEWTRVPWWKNE